MPLTGNAIDNNALASLANRAGPAVTSAIQKASLKTGVNFAYLMQKADTESSFDTDAKAKGSSAKGLYQFINSTWMHMVKKYGDKYGLSDYADKISDSGKVSDKATKKEILALRDNPEISALMAGEYAAENKQSLINSGIKEKDIGSTELYLAHFLGAGAASEFIKGMKQNPMAPAAQIFPKAANANHNVFYTKTQHQRSLGDIYAMFDKKFDDGMTSKTPAAQSQTLVADADDAPTTTTRTRASAYHSGAQYASNSILRTLPMASNTVDNTGGNADLTALLNHDDDDADIGTMYSLSNQQRPIPLGNSRVANPAQLMEMADNTVTDTRTAQAKVNIRLGSHGHGYASASRRSAGTDEDDADKTVKTAMAESRNGYMSNYRSLNQ
jgi:hypothetical protein